MWVLVWLLAHAGVSSCGLRHARRYGKGKYYTVNVPLKDGMDDESYKLLYEPIMQKVTQRTLAECLCAHTASPPHVPYIHTARLQWYGP
jgi:hypothetical protein